MIKQGKLYSIRMRATKNNHHACGAERIVPEDRIDRTVGELIARAMDRGVRPDQTTLSIDAIDPALIQKHASLDLYTLQVPDPVSSRETAARILETVGVSSLAIRIAMEQIGRGAAPSGANMRGAMIMDAVTGERLEPDQERGIRASRFDWTDPALDEITRLLAAVGLVHHRTREALALATKVAHGPGMMAELCWSDESDYTAGYIAARDFGYVRFPFLKQEGDRHGGRAFFVNHERRDLDSLIHYLEKTSVMIDRVGVCSAAMTPELFVRTGRNQKTAFGHGRIGNI